MGVLALLFFLVILTIFFMQDNDQEIDQMQMGEAELPVVYVMYQGMTINCLHGYTIEMDPSAMRDSLSPLGEERRFNIKIHDYENTITGISYEIRTIDKERLLEKKEITQWKEDDTGILAEFNFENLIEKNTEYLLTIHLSTESEKDISYYTRILQGVDHITEKVQFITDFSRKTFDKEAAKDLIPYLESGPSGDNSNFGRVNINSSFNQIIWGDLAPTQITNPIPTIKEINGSITSMELSYEIKALNMYGSEEYYHVTEFYRTNFTESRTYLLTYERAVQQYFKAASDNINGSRINLGILPDIDIEVSNSEKGNYLAFVSNGNLWSYDTKNNKISCIFTFIDKNDDGVRDAWNQHQIRIISNDDSGNIAFVVYGYMNRGAHEGQVGLALYFYSGSNNIVSEELFIPYQKSFSYLKQSLGNLFYINHSNNFYFMLEGNVYSVDLASREYTLVVEGLKKGCYVIHKDGNILAWQVENDLYNSSSIKELQLDTNQEFVITADEGEKLRVLGFVENDLVYGIAKEEDVFINQNGTNEFYMERIVIVDTNKQQVGMYREEGFYVTDASINENMITLDRVRKTGERIFEVADKEHITNNVALLEEDVTVTWIATEKKKKEVGINLKSPIVNSSLKIDNAKEIVFTPGRELILNEMPESLYRYFVYGKGTLLDVFDKMGDAIQLADQNAGIVLDNKGDYVWSRGNRKDSVTLSAVVMEASENNTIAACINAMLQYAGVQRDSTALLDEGQTALEIVNNNLNQKGMDLTGCTLKQILYFVSSGKPVMGKIGEGHYVLVIGYDAYNAILLDPKREKSYKIGLEDGTALFTKAGNQFISYQD